MSPVSLTREDIVIYLRRTTSAQRLAYRGAHLADAMSMAFRAPAKYSSALLRAAGRCDIDAPRTPYAAAKERQQRRYSLVSYAERKYMAVQVNGEPLPVPTSQSRRVWA